MHYNMVSPYGILLSKHENFEKLSILTKSMALIIMVGSNFLSEASKVLDRMVSKLILVQNEGFGMGFDNLDWYLKVLRYVRTI